MSTRKGLHFQTVCFAIEGLNSFAMVFYFSYLFFYMRDRFGFHDKANLALAALLGFVYVFSAWQGGRFAQRRGYFTALKLGLIAMLVSLAIGSQLGTALGHIIIAAAVTAGQCLTWPTLEALISDGETPARLPRTIGVYNVVWAVAAAVAFFSGGTLIETLGYESIFYGPIVIQVVQLGLTFWLQRHATELARAAANQPPSPTPPPDPHRPPAGPKPVPTQQTGLLPSRTPNRETETLRRGEGPSPTKAKGFLHMAWLANPFAYIAINTLIAVLPGIAARFHLTPMLAGFACSLWCFARLGVFVLLWHWPDWHYRFRWLVGAFVTLIATFALILTAPNLGVLIAAQIFFGGAIGLIYYSSLFYSMDAGEARGEHGGIHEAAIGAGNCLGPAVGAASLQFFPQSPHSGVMAVSVLLLCGFGALLTIWRTAK